MTTSGMTNDGDTAMIQTPLDLWEECLNLIKVFQDKLEI
jgi:hypothetical protein